jgi:CheY-like chemotaxis protein
MKCLLIDDDIDDQELFGIAVERLDQQIALTTVVGGKEALQLLKTDGTYRPEYIFLDLNMPGMTGKECLSEIRQIPWLSDVPVIIYTTSSLQRDRIETTRLGASDFLTKQPSIEDTRKALVDLFTRHTKGGAI